MGEVVGFVQKVANKYSAIYVRNPRSGSGGTQHASVTEAMRALENAAQRKLQWVPDAAAVDGSERWEATDPGWWPGDFGSSLKHFYTAAYGNTPDSSTLLVPQWGCRLPGVGGDLVAAVGQRPTYVRGAQPSMLFPPSSNVVRFLNSTLSLTKPFTVAISVAHQTPDAARNCFAVEGATGGASAFGLSVDNGGTWRLTAGAFSDAGPAATSKDAVVAVIDAATSTWYVNGVSAGNLASVPAAGIGNISVGSATLTWSGSIYGMVSVNRVLTTSEIARLNGYMSRLAP